VHRRHIEEKISENFVSLCQEGLNECIGCIRIRTLFRVRKKDRIIEDSRKLCKEGIDLVQVCTERTLV
jgi:hypothetical protein